MAWLVLIISAVFEAVWATALGYSDGLTQPIPTIIFAAGLAVSLGGLAYAMKSIPVGVAYSVWVGIGAALTVIIAMTTGSESASIWKVLFIAGIIACVIGLKLVHSASDRARPSEDAH